MRGPSGNRGRAGSDGAGSNGAGSNGAGSNGAGSRRLGSRGAGSRRMSQDGYAADAGQPEMDSWGEPTGRGATRANGTRANGTRANGTWARLASADGSPGDQGTTVRGTGAGGTGARGTGAGRAGAGRSRAARTGAGAARGSRRGGPVGASEYPGDYGDGPGGGRTALRGEPGDFWAGNDGTGRGSRSRLAERPGVRHGGGAGGGSGRGRGGGRGPGPGPDPRSGGERFKDWLLYGSWWRHWTWKKVLFVMGGGLAAFILLGIIAVAVVYAMTPIPTDVSQQANWQSSSVYFSDGKPLGTFTTSQDINRQLLTTSQIPQNVEAAIIAAEDRNFYHEGGISVTGIARAAYDDIFGSGGLQGGSTITEEYAKNYYSNIGASRSATTKIKEIFVSIKLAHARSKPWILTNYLNTVPFGDNIFGVWAAADTFFGKDLAKQGTTLNTAQAAMLGAMPNQPGNFNPDPAAGADYTSLVQRWQYVLTNMARDGSISQQEANSLCSGCALPQAEKAFNKSIQLNESTTGNGWTGTTGYLMDMVRQELETTYHFSSAQIDTGGLHITTTFSPSMMQGLSRAVSAERQQIAAAAAAQGRAALPYYDHFGISLENPRTGAIVAIYGGPGYISNQTKCARLFCQYNMAEAPHPVGSSMKPYVLAAAINQGMDVQDSVLNGNSPLWIPPQATALDRAELSTSPNPPGMSPATAKSIGWWESQGDTPLGPISVAVAAAQSSDPAFTDLAHRVGVQNIINTAQAFGVGQNPFNAAGTNDLQGLNTQFSPSSHSKYALPGSVQIALGQGDLTPIEQASTFATLIDGGIYRAPHVISKLSRSTPAGQQPIQIHVATHTVMSPAAAADEDYALSFDNINGTAAPNATWPGRPVIGKTGTLGNGSQASEAWFVGAIPQYTMAVGLWTNTQAQNLDNLPGLGNISGSYGGAWPAATWKAFMTAKFANLPVASLPTPNYAGFVRWVQALPKMAKKTPTCRLGQFQNCKCPQGNPLCTRPNPTPSCPQAQFGQPCNGTSPNPTPSCGQFGQPCNSPSPTASPSPSCTPTFGQPCPQGATKPDNATVSPGSGSSSRSRSSPTLAAVLLPAEEAQAASVLLVT